MKNLIKFAALAMLILLLANCSSNHLETNQNAIANIDTNARFVNESLSAVSVYVYDANGNVTVASENITAGDVFDMSYLNNGETTFRIVTSNSDRIAVLDVQDSKNYHVILNDDNSVSTIQTNKI